MKLSRIPLPSFGPAAAPGDSFLGPRQQGAASPSLIRKAVDQRGLSQFIAATSACALIAAAGLFHAWVRTQVTEEGYQLSRLSAEHQALLREREKLTLWSAQLKTPGRIEQLAREKLGMGPAATDRVVVLAENRLLSTAPSLPPNAVVRR